MGSLLTLRDFHELFKEYVFKPDGSFTCVVQAYQYSTLFGVLDVVFDQNGNILSCQGSPIVPFDSSGASLTASQKEDLDKYLDGPSWKATVPDNKAMEALNVVLAQSAELRKRVIATVPEPICLERIPGQGRSVVCPCTDSEQMGGGVCNVVSKAFLELTPTADFALQNAGGCRQDIRTGDYTFADAYELLPFANTLFTLDLTGQQVIDVLNEAFVFSSSLSTGAYPYGYGIRWSVTYPTPGVTYPTPAVSRMTVEVNPRLAGVWMPIDVSATYTVVTNSFVAAGQDGYVTFRSATNVVDTFTSYAQAFVDYAIEVGQLIDLPDDEYSTQSITGGRMCR
jgi:5'-nucleotidase / UDP-sugar diphosphatase